MRVKHLMRLSTFIRHICTNLENAFGRIKCFIYDAFKSISNATLMSLKRRLNAKDFHMDSLPQGFAKNEIHFEHHV